MSTQQARHRPGITKGDGRHLPARNRAPLRAYVRDVVDSRPRLLALVVVASVLVAVPGAAVAQQYLSLFSLAMLILIIANGVLARGDDHRFKARAKLSNANISPTATGW